DMPADPDQGKAPQESPATTDPARHRPLNRWERAFSASSGVILGTVALIAMFDGKNDVADSIALLVAGVLVVMAVQGTPLIRLGGKDVSFEMGRREAVVEIARARAVEDPVEAKALLQGYQLADPGARHDPLFVRAAAGVYESTFMSLSRTLLDDAVGR